MFSFNFAFVHFQLTSKQVFHTYYDIFYDIFSQTLYPSAPASQAIVAPSVKKFALFSSFANLMLFNEDLQKPSISLNQGLLVVTEVHVVGLRPLGEGDPLVDGIQQLVLDLSHRVTVQHFDWHLRPGLTLRRDAH